MQDKGVPCPGVQPHVLSGVPPGDRSENLVCSLQNGENRAVTKSVMRL